MDIDEEELVWQALQDDNFPSPPSPAEDSEFPEEERPFQHFLPAVSSITERRPEQDWLIPPAVPFHSDGSSVPEQFVGPLEAPGVYAVPAECEPAAETRCSTAEIGICPLKTPHRRIGEIEGDCVSITGPCGNRVYANTTTGDLKARKCTTLRQHKGSLLSRPITSLLERAEEACVERVGPAPQSHEFSTEDDVIIRKEGEELWVDKYAPKQFTELSSDEQVNREVVRWLKEWDPCVFGRKPVSGFLKSNASQQQKQFYQGRKGGPKHALGAGRPDKLVTDREGKNPLRGEPTNNATSDRPAEKVLLLSGPPGLGKTTLANVAARHCGYRIVEVNASDDRVSATLQAKILNAIEMKSVIGDGKPNCLILDEVDGSLGGPEGKAAIDTLLKIIAAETKIHDGEGLQSSLNRRPNRKGGPTVRLLRPVICICNDLYAPALRNLRTVARVCKFPPPSCARLATRLKQVCSYEGYHASAGALTTLAEHTECDIRLCLHTLQFLHRKRQSLDTVSIPSQVMASKNIIRNLDTMWKEVFQSGAKHRRAPRHTTDDINKGMEGIEFNRLYDIFTNNGDFDLADKVHDNVLHMRLNDTSLQKLVDCLKILADTDIMGCRVASRQQYFLNAYQPSNLFMVRRLMTHSQQDAPQLHCSTISQRVRSELRLKREMLRDWQSSMSVGVRKVYSLDNIAEDLISPLLAVMSPRSLRPVAFQMLTTNEKRDVRELIGSMLTYGITYKQSRAASTAIGSDNSAFVMEPPLHSLISFQDHFPRYCPLSASIQQLLGHEAEMERIRLAAARAISAKVHIDMHRSQAAAVLRVIESCKTFAKQAENEETGKMHAGRTHVPSTKSQKRPSHDLTNFFSRSTTGSHKDVVDSKAVSQARRDSRPIVFKYQEGFTSAVKRPMFVRDFIL